MNITDATYYERGKKFIPNNNNKNSEVPGVPNVGSELDSLISEIERPFIIELLGIESATELEVALLDLNNADQKWKDLVEGVNYTIDTIVYRFDGLRGNNKESLLAYYVFCKYMEQDESTYSTTGVVRSDASNAHSFSPSRKYLDCWYLFLNAYQNKTSANNPIVFERNGILGIDYYGQKRKGGLVTLETFLTDHEEDYVDFHIERHETKNSLGI